MEKKQILALVLIGMVIILLPYYQEMINGDQYAQRVQQQEQADSLTKVTEPKKKIAPAPPEVVKKSAPIKAEKAESTVKYVEQDSTEKTFRLSTEKVEIVLSNKKGASLQQFILKDFALGDSALVNMIDPDIDNGVFLAFQTNKGDYINTGDYTFFTDKQPGAVVLKGNDSYQIDFYIRINNDLVRKTYTFYGNRYHFDVSVYFSNPEKTLLNREYQFGWKNGLPSTESYKADDNNYMQAYVYMAEELENYQVKDEGPGETVTLTGTADWVAVRTKYFLGSVANLNADVSNGIYFGGRGIKRTDYVQRLYDVGYNARYNNPEGDQSRVYLGPLDNSELSAYDNQLDVLIMNNGWYERVFRFFSLIVLKVLELLHRVIPNYGIVIIIFSILIKIIVHPLTKKSYTSMKSMQQINPLVAELKEKYKGDPQRLNKETMELYKKHGVNPLGGCLPTLIQMPLLIALFIVFRSTIQLRGAMFIPGWVPDLSRPDTLFMLPFSLPMYGDQFNLLPILMAVTMLFQSKMTMQDPKQKAMVYIMPLFMLLIFNKFPSGLNLYYTLFNLLTIVQQKFINTSTAEPALEPARVKPKKKKK